MLPAVYVSMWLCVCAVVFRALKCESVSKLLLNCSREGWGGSPAVSWRTRNCSYRYTYTFCMYTYAHMKDTHTHTQTGSPTVSARLILLLLWSSSPFPPSCSSCPPLLGIPNFIFLLSSSHRYKRGELDFSSSLFLSHGPHPAFFFLFFFFFLLICLPTQSVLILLVTADIRVLLTLFDSLPERHSPGDPLPVSTHCSKHTFTHTHT